MTKQISLLISNGNRTERSTIQDIINYYWLVPLLGEWFQISWVRSVRVSIWNHKHDYVTPELYNTKSYLPINCVNNKMRESS